MGEVRELLESLELENTNDSLEDIAGSMCLTFSYEDNTEKLIGLTSNLLADGAITYKVNKDICGQLHALFEEAQKKD